MPMRQPDAHGRWRRVCLGMALVLALAIATLLLPLPIRTTVTPPSSLSEPTPVFLMDFGTTSSLVLTVNDERMVAYVYGDWNYYALRNQSAFDGVNALLWPSQGTLGRKEIAGRPRVDTIRHGIGSDVQEIYAFAVERSAVDYLQQELDRIYVNGLDMAVNAYGMTFVHHPQMYTYWSNSNHMTAAWLGSLGCRIHGPAFGSRWRVHAAG
jgi:hypothetical protein